MNEHLLDIIASLATALFIAPLDSHSMLMAAKIVPFVLLLEVPVHLVTLMGVLLYAGRKLDVPPMRQRSFPRVSCLITCYSEGRDVIQTIRTLAEQIYPGSIEIIAMIDGAKANRDTHEAALSMRDEVSSMVNRTLLVIPKWQRGGRVSALNTGLAHATGEIVMALDGDTSFDNDMVTNATRHFEDPHVLAVAGNLRVRNAFKSLVTRLQALEYLVSISMSKTGLSAFNVVNNISGAFGIFRTSMVRRVGGWNTGTAEDLDMTLRLKNTFGAHPKSRIVFDPECIGHTDAPDTLKGFLKQRLRWDGDLYYLYFRKHPLSFQPRIMGMTNFLAQLWTGMMFQIVMPFMILMYTAYIAIFHSLAAFAASTLFVYVFYLVILVLLYFVALMLISERPSRDLRLLPVLPLAPLFTYGIRLWATVAVAWEIVGRGHLDTSMAPWWVLKRSENR